MNGSRHTQDDPRAEAPPPMPRWVKSLLVTLLVVAALAVLVMAFLGGNHGPGRHAAVGVEPATAASAQVAGRL